MQLLLCDPDYTDTLASFLASLGQRPVVAAPARVDLAERDGESARLELEIYLRVWHVLHPEADVTLAA